MVQSALAEQRPTELAKSFQVRIKKDVVKESEWKEANKRKSGTVDKTKPLIKWERPRKINGNQRRRVSLMVGHVGILEKKSL